MYRSREGMPRMEWELMTECEGERFAAGLQ